MNIYNQTLRRLTQWDTTGVSESEVEWNINLIQNIGETLELPKDAVERDILQASRLPTLQGRTPSTNKPKDPALSGSGPKSLFACIFHDAPDTPTPKIAALVAKGRSAMGALHRDNEKSKPNIEKSRQKVEKPKQKADKEATAEKKRKGHHL